LARVNAYAWAAIIIKQECRDQGQARLTRPRPRPLKAVGFEPSLALRSYDCVNYGVVTLAGLLAAHPNTS